MGGTAEAVSFKLSRLCQDPALAALTPDLEADAAEADQHHGPRCRRRNRRSVGRREVVASNAAIEGKSDVIDVRAEARTRARTDADANPADESVCTEQIAPVREWVRDVGTVRVNLRTRATSNELPEQVARIRRVCAKTDLVVRLDRAFPDELRPGGSVLNQNAESRSCTGVSAKRVDEVIARQIEERVGRNSGRGAAAILDAGLDAATVPRNVERAIRVADILRGNLGRAPTTILTRQLAPRSGHRSWRGNIGDFVIAARDLSHCRRRDCTRGNSRQNHEITHRTPTTHAARTTRALRMRLVSLANFDESIKVNNL